MCDGADKSISIERNNLWHSITDLDDLSLFITPVFYDCILRVEFIMIIPGCLAVWVLALISLLHPTGTRIVFHHMEKKKSLPLEFTLEVVDRKSYLELPTKPGKVSKCKH